uniref:DUF4371 domain-containing protein n=1 Tax=Tanacetum cinerariifolium TaxID=118510 RepID=A0A6L2N970_TANCI|nr:hypothetical protein [Tanacetum cinerariifolium]
MSISALMKCTAAIRQFAYGNTVDAFDKYLQMMSWQGQYGRGDKKYPTIMLEAVASIQKDIVECFKKETVNCICLEIGDDVLSLLVDESSDVVKKEQMVVVLRYVNKFGILKERFIGIIHMGNISSSTLKVAIDYLFNKHNLNLQQEFGDCFSEGSNNLLDCMLVLSQHDSFSEFNVSKLVNLNEMYPRDFTYKERLCLHMELGVYYQIMRSDKDFDKLDGIVKLAEKMVDKKKHTSHPLVYRLFKLALDLPLATTTVERCFSKMKLIETGLRNRIVTPHKFPFNNLAVFV